MSRGSSPWTTGSSERRMQVNPGAKKHSPSPLIPSSVSILTKVQSKFPSTTAVVKRTIFIWSSRGFLAEPLVKRVCQRFIRIMAHNTDLLQWSFGRSRCVLELLELFHFMLGFSRLPLLTIQPRQREVRLASQRTPLLEFDNLAPRLLSRCGITFQSGRFPKSVERFRHVR